MKSQTAYLDSLAVCDKLLGTVSEKVLLEMKSRLYLNLGLTYEKDSEEDCARAKSFMEKALVIARYCFFLLILIAKIVMLLTCIPTSELLFICETSVILLIDCK